MASFENIHLATCFGIVKLVTASLGAGSTSLGFVVDLET